MLSITLIDNGLTAGDFNCLKVAVGFQEAPIPQVEKALTNGLFNVVAVCDEQVVGMGRLVGDGAMYWYLQEICVLPQYQGNGIGKAIVNRLMEYVNENAMPGTRVTVGLMAAKGKEAFYEKLGFVARPNEGCGAGMEKRLVVSSSGGDHR